jgi:DNA-binding winged helix-turn-helix (wHTH) protein
MDHIIHKVLRFDRFVLDLTRGCLRTSDHEIDLRPKAFQLLTYLAVNAGAPGAEARTSRRCVAQRQCVR